uniref:HAT C-terminal dimerisation domain-containing protein n=1 Tax=Solanum lycopersicum TaxID=4081 RepID=A0A3Q7FGL7_SOLLC
MNLKALGNDFDAYINQITEPTEDVLKWWRDRTKGFPKLVPMVRDILAMQASSVASEGVFSAARFQLGEHRHSLAADSLEISVLFRDWINAERRNLGREPLPTKFQDDVDEVMQDHKVPYLKLLEIVYSKKMKSLVHAINYAFEDSFQHYLENYWMV